MGRAVRGIRSERLKRKPYRIADRLGISATGETCWGCEKYSLASRFLYTEPATPAAAGPLTPFAPVSSTTTTSLPLLVSVKEPNQPRCVGVRASVQVPVLP